VGLGAVGVAVEGRPFGVQGVATAQGAVLVVLDGGVAGGNETVLMVVGHGVWASGVSDNMCV